MTWQTASQCVPDVSRTRTAHPHTRLESQESPSRTNFRFNGELPRASVAMALEPRRPDAPRSMAEAGADTSARGYGRRPR